MAPPKKPKQTQSKENADSESDTLEDDKQKPEMDMGSIAQTLKQINDRLDKIESTHTSTIAKTAQTLSTMKSVQKSLIQLTEKVDRQEATVRALQAKVFGPERGPVVEICAGFSAGARQKHAYEDVIAKTWGDIGDTKYQHEQGSMSTDTMRNDTRDTFPPSTHDGPQRYPGERPSYDRYTEPRDDFPMERPKHGRRRHDTRSGVEASHRPSDINVTIDKFDGKPGEWDNWIHQFEFIAEAYSWDPDEKMTRLVSCLRGPALTAHRSLPREERYDYDGCIEYLGMIYGHTRPAARTTLRAELSVLKQEEGESVDTFADRVYALTVEAYPNMHKDLYNSLSVPAFLRGIRDRNAAQEAMKFSDLTTVRTSVEAVLHIQCATRTFGGRNLSNRQVAMSVQSI